ncbi:MAG: hypothetical protein O2923_08870 [Verrucomicrobia bacterium]|nr:hypothetical protein [Verrucomicrobiota bacterium]MDA1087899.1 hypothetical protein [Verrucomicrobiota bacterium]
MKILEPFYDAKDMSACVTADTAVAQLNEQARPDALIFPLFLDSSVTVSKLIESTSWTPRSFRYGPIADNVLGLVFELHNGKEIQLGGRVVKNVTGFDFTRFLCRSGSRFGRVRRAVLRLRALSEYTAYRSIRGDTQMLQSFAANFMRNPWAAVIDLFDMTIDSDGAAIQLSFGCTESRLEQYDHFLSNAATATGLHFSASEYQVPPMVPYAAAKTVYSRCIPDCLRLVDSFGGRAHIFLGNAYFHYQPERPESGDPALGSALQQLHRDYAALGGHVTCDDLTYAGDTPDRRWESEFEAKLAALP